MGYYPRYIWISGRRLYFYGQYNSYTDALKIAKHYKKKLRNNYFILIPESPFLGRKRYTLYMNKVYFLG